MDMIDRLIDHHTAGAATSLVASIITRPSAVPCQHAVFEAHADGTVYCYGCGVTF